MATHKYTLHRLSAHYQTLLLLLDDCLANKETSLANRTAGWPSDNGQLSLLSILFFQVTNSYVDDNDDRDTKITFKGRKEKKDLRIESSNNTWNSQTLIQT